MTARDTTGIAGFTSSAPARASDVAPAAITRLRARFRGALLRPGEEGYAEARRIWNGAIDRRPALIARCVGADDVVEVVRFAREHDLPASVRGGGHAVAGHAVCDGGVMIDLSLMRAVQVDAAGRPSDPDAARHTAWVGARWEALRPHATGVFSHFLSDEGAAGVATAYGARLARLTALKNRWDPTNFFRFNANIPPTGDRAPTGIHMERP